MQARDHLGHRQIGIGDLLARQPAFAVGVALDHPLEIAEVLGQPVGEEFLAASQRLGFLFLVIKAAAERMMGVVDFGNEIGQRQLQLMHP